MSGLTTHYSWVLPTVGGDATTWGSAINADLSDIDTKVFAANQGVSPVGAIIMFGGVTAPANWLLCDGATYLISSYPTLASVIGGYYGGDGISTFSVPNFAGRFPIGLWGGHYALGAEGGEEVHSLLAGEMPVHAHGVVDPTHIHGVTDPTHSHFVNDPMHTHGATEAAHTHSLNGSFGFGVGASGSTVLNSGAAGARTDSQQPTISVAAASTGVTLNASATGVAVNGAATGISIQNAGGGAAHNNLPPYSCVNFIIRYQ